MDWAIATFRKDGFAATADWGDPSGLPVFIVGMPRSGTTLVEQIAASHSQVFGAGERKDISDILRGLEQGATRRPPAEWGRDAVPPGGVGADCQVAGAGGQAERVIDKLPDNCLRLGQIAVLFPNARIIVCRRDPRDVCLSCYVQQFSDGMAWTSDQTDLAVRAQETERLMDHWRAVLPLRMIEIEYETLVADLEGESRRLIAFLGLDWDPNSLAFHTTERSVMTASYWQVRQPVYASSLGRWRNYRRHLQPLLAGLAGLVPSEDDVDWDALAADPTTALAIAMPHHRARRFSYADPIYRALLRRNPDDPTALHLLGLLMVDRGESAAAVALISRSLALRPDNAPALADLARAQVAAGDAKAAAETARRAMELDPALPDASIQLGYALLMQQDAAGAVEVLQRVTEMAPRSLEAQVALATALTHQKDHRFAAEAWQAAVALKPNDRGLLFGYATSLGEIERFDEALAAYRQAEVLTPGDPRAQYGIVLCLLHTGDFAEAAAVCRRVLEITPDRSAFWLALADCEALTGHFDAAAEAYRHALALEPESGETLFGLVALGKDRDNNTTADAAKKALDDRSKPVLDRVAAGFALGRLCDQHKAYDEAFAAYALANELRRGERAALGSVFDRVEFHGVLEGLIASFDPQTFAATAGWGDPSELPVFIVGTPRSGTSLVEQIAASHPLVFGVGEQKVIHDILTRFGDTQTPGSQFTWNRASVRREAMAHLQYLRDLGGGAMRVIDKIPDNITNLGHIAVLFPHARIVVCRRDLRDVGLSCFFQYFRDEAVTWTDDLADCGFRAREIERLMAHWRQVLPIPILEIQYETLVADLEGESRRLIDFLGLDWDPACLSFHESERAVMTASHWQVRQPLYASSVGRWRHYRQHLAPLLRELEGVALPDDEDPTHAG